MRQILMATAALAALSVPASVNAQADREVRPSVLVTTEEFTLRNLHADPAAAVDRNALERMRLAWQVEMEHPVSHAPLVEDGRIYGADWGGYVFAIDAGSGEVVWRNKVEEPKTQWPWHGFAGTGTLGGGLLFEASTEGNAFALAPETGEVLWKTRIAEDEHAGSIGRLVYHDGLLFVGLQSVEEPLTKQMPDFQPDFQGKVMALDARTGRTVWETRLVEAPHNGVAVWSSFALDPELGALYFTTGNNYTGEATALSDSLVTANARTGEIVWARQVTQHDVWTPVNPQGPDYDFAGAPQLFEAEIDGQPRRLVGAGQKSGIYYVWDRVTGEPIWNTVVGYGGVDGGIHGEASIGSDRILVWSNNNYLHRQPPGQAKLTVKALDPSTGQPLWVRDEVQPALLFAAGFLAGDTYFLPSLDGRIRAYDAGTGETVWTSGKIGPITTSVTYEDGRLYAVAGKPGIFGDWADGPNGVFAFAPAAGQGQQVAQTGQPAEQVRLGVARSEQHGPYVTDAQGRALYLFTADQHGQSGQETASTCYEACAEAWPPLLSETGDPTVSEALDPHLLGTIQRRTGTTQVTYNGWPLYYYVKDRGPGEATGQDVHGFGGEWYLVGPEGTKVAETE
ncbi:MAG TPA: PQQ-binding-like beta-propeller repeat protein [Kaistia sp.]|jgi:polyvinyl alcohol dehydrogenase (cytochrome)|nr:PQQ-binding-like beta-propeller repeat protein [Kaistia sp.]